VGAEHQPDEASGEDRPHVAEGLKQAARGARLEWQLARLALTFGEDRVRRVEIADPEAPLPELRWMWRSVASGERGVPR
jgi:hypothetical protein